MLDNRGIPDSRTPWSACHSGSFVFDPSCFHLSSDMHPPHMTRTYDADQRPPVLSVRVDPATIESTRAATGVTAGYNSELCDIDALPNGRTCPLLKRRDNSRPRSAAESDLDSVSATEISFSGHGGKRVARVHLAMCVLQWWSLFFKNGKIRPAAHRTLL